MSDEGTDRLSMPAKPLREVVWIEEVTSPRGNLEWRLRLECGHRARRPIPRPNLGQALLLGPDRYLSRRLAPKRVRCQVCSLLCEEETKRCFSGDLRLTYPRGAVGVP